jgi:asparagine synthase (glutamine-hydrolysing)
MCGICGIVGVGSGDARDVVERQIATLRHRGPDVSGSFGSGRGAIGQNRLSIIDLVHGDPPITNEHGTVGVVLNGEIYNYLELRRELEASGHRFSSDGDTEVIAHLTESLDPLAVCRRLDGMFAFAVWDPARERLMLGRDRVGKKPLFYCFASGRLTFGSEIKALLADPDVPRRLEPSAIPAYLTFGYVPTPRTFFEGIVSLPPGHVLTLEAGGEPRVEAYWAPPLPSPRGLTERRPAIDDAAAQIRAGLDRAVQRRLISDVPLGAFLSGGIDSSAIVGLMAAHSGQPVQTFTIGFDDHEGFDERPYARLAAERHATDHHEFVVHPHAVDLIERLVWHHDQPFGDSSAVPTFLLAELTKGHVTVALSGDGGDELFAGYERFAAGLAAARYAALPARVQSGVTSALQTLPRTALRGRAGSLQRFAGVARLGLPAAYRNWISYVSDSDREDLLDGAGNDWALRDYQAVWDSTTGAPRLDRLLSLNLRTYLLDDLLVKADRMSMAHGLEVRSPFLDKDLLALAAALPPSLKARGLSLKRVLKKAVEDIVPAPILDRPKKGFGVPLDRWFRQDLNAYVAATLGAADAHVRRHLDAGAVDRMLAEHDSGARNHGHALWTLLTLEVFLRRENW